MRPATREEIDKYLECRGVCLDGGCAADFYIVERGEASLMFSVYGLDSDFCDMHICAPRNKASILNLYDMLKEAFAFTESLGFKNVVTSVPVGKNKTAHNMANKLGFTHVGDFDGFSVYERCLKWR